ncbi:ParB/RepB/Spo0J family partition protein [Serratia fonticola]|uniref:ParB/RepB/Spo0J family partition protein n=1 Tax=Serratia fonticola TaxID=47917 RepID=UPI001C47F040|nr:ParB/RepB/Spo0J family partition protein [Serratia fonticola]QXN65278.1 ParB/RepB/Spo0J family partition protein [Serratia fonticola]
MSVTESKAKTTKKSSSKAKAKQNVVAETLLTLLESTPVELVSYSRLADSELNTRIVPHTEKEVRELADSIKGVGILQNLIVMALPDGQLAVVGGGGRKKATGLLVAEGLVSADQPFVPVKIVPAEMAVAASWIENNHRKGMHPAEQIIGFRTMAAEGKTPAQIGDLLGFGAHHVQRMLKLSRLAPAIIDAVAKDELTAEHCHVLALEDDHERQLQVLELAKARSYSGKPQVNDIRNIITASEVSISNSPRFAFVGADVFEEGQIRRDLFSGENDGYVDSVLLDTHVMNKLEKIAQEIQAREGWSWCLHRLNAISEWGRDSNDYTLQQPPAQELTPEEQARMEEWNAALEDTDNHDDEYEIQQQIDDLETEVEIRSWTPEQKAQSGIVVSYEQGDFRVQRGVLKQEPEPEEAENTPQEGEETAAASGEPRGITYTRAPDPADDISLPLLTKMSSERTLAVQAALLQDTPKAVALLAWKLCQNVLGTYCSPTSALKASISYSHSSLTSNAPSGSEGTAYLALEAEKERISALLPKGWEKDFTTFFTLSGETLMAILGLCTACALDGVQTRECGHTSRSTLDPLETALGFHMRDWWQPTKANFFDHLKKPQIIEFLTEAGFTGAASDAEKMKKGDAAELAEERMKGNRWVPVWLKAPEAKTETATTEEDIQETADTNPTPDAA